MSTINGDVPRGMSISISPTSIQPSTVPLSLPIQDSEQQASSSRRSSHSSSSSSGPDHSLDLPSLQPLSHSHPLLSSEDFNADEFLLSRIHIPLEELRGELRAYLNELKEELVRLINEDYEEFISLRTGLRGEEGRLKGLQEPMREVRGEVEIVRDILYEHQEKVQTKLDERSALREEKALLDLLQRLFDTLTRAETLLDTTPDEEHGSAKMINRVAGEYTQVVYLVNKARMEGCAIVDVVEDRIQNIKSRLSKDLSTLLTAELAEPNIPRLKQCLKTYELIEGWEEAEEVVRRSIRSFCRSTITSTSLTVPRTPTAPKTPHSSQLNNPLEKSLRLPSEDQSPLASLYNKVLTQMETYGPLLQISEDISEKFDFFSNIVWPEIAGALIDNLGSTIFAAGRPDELHKHYTTTHKFITLLESFAPSTRNVISMRTSPSYESFERRWQLPVYFQLRWKEIVGTLENSLASASNDKAVSGDWELSASASIWKALETTWSDDVFIEELAPRFWRLSLQIISRFGTYLKSTLDTFTIKEEDTTQEDAALKFTAAAIVDLDQLKAKVSEIKVINTLGLEEHLTIPITPYSNVLLQILTRRCIDPLKLIRSIASQFRSSTTTSSTPTSANQASYFIPNVLKPISNLYTLQPQLKSTYGREWSTQILDSVLVNYSSILGSVKKTEDLLRKHRKSKKTGLSSFFSTSSSGATSTEGDGKEEKEEERFKLQMIKDIDTLRQDASKSCEVDIEELGSWKELVDVINKPSE
ncbi:hypothetical protein I302_108329 [Kwoniella bestiolae CBS 10118]|uniref:Conserved oligomeric Golgi complex subunit 2 n=1 Tax=Kwoniella bestiolae CBS 10118 TaxID=1296100 RepID=A0A1B9FW22_9TREE|nr:hypothetical protein I302_07301 [Kwoniella bestiolae CBS 10118]OCF22951.1 hypothetical protein I302_07301 [Kwoniella bestiolae CBS 10118]